MYQRYIEFKVPVFIQAVLIIQVETIRFIINVNVLITVILDVDGIGNGQAA